MSSKVTWWGQLDDARPLVAQADLFLLSSVDDPFPLACLEALALMKPCVVYKGTGVSEILEGVGGCRVVSEHTPEAFFEALKAVMQESLDTEAVERINRDISSIESLYGRINRALQLPTTK